VIIRADRWLNSYRESGFTLIEVIVSLIIVGIMTAVAGMAIVTGIRGYVFARDNTVISQKARMAVARMGRELMELTDVTTADASRITYKRPDGGGVITQTIYLDPIDDVIKISAKDDGGDGDLLIDRVSSFTLTYCKEMGNWVAGADDIQSLDAVKIDLDLTRSDGGADVAFSTTVIPRNTGAPGISFRKVN